jgi:2-hydroxy-3-keto-5-methylthiopentenyl-1-phosphate phosphatase
MQNLKKIHRNFPETCFDVLTKSLRVAPGFRWLVQALKAEELVRL